MPEEACKRRLARGGLQEEACKRRPARGGLQETSWIWTGTYPPTNYSHPQPPTYTHLPISTCTHPPLPTHLHPPGYIHSNPQPLTAHPCPHTATHGLTHAICHPTIPNHLHLFTICVQHCMHIRLHMLPSLVEPFWSFGALHASHKSLQHLAGEQQPWQRLQKLLWSSPSSHQHSGSPISLQVLHLVQVVEVVLVVEATSLLATTRSRSQSKAMPSTLVRIEHASVLHDLCQSWCKL